MDFEKIIRSQAFYIEPEDNDIVYVRASKLGEYIKNIVEESFPVDTPVKPEIADIKKITMWVDMIWNDIFDDDELPLTAAQMNIIGRYINQAKEKIREQFSV